MENVSLEPYDRGTETLAIKQCDWELEGVREWGEESCALINNGKFM